MKFEYLEQIIKRIEKDIACPQCETLFEKENIDINAVGSHYIDFLVRCQSCGANVMIRADMESLAQGVRRLPLKRDFSKRSKSITTLSEKEIQSLSNFLKNFRGQDVQELF